MNVYKQLAAAVFLSGAFGLALMRGSAQDCVLQAPVIKIDFGSTSSPGLNMPAMENYRRVDDACPQDGHYTFVASTDDCFGGHWHTLMRDHTGNGAGGKVMLVNAAYQPGLFFAAPLEGLSPNTTYEFGAWVVNVCKPRYECTNIRPNLVFNIEDESGRRLARFGTGPIAPTGELAWMRYAAFFKTPAAVGTLVLRIENRSEGGCGNDFAMDDITIRECVPPPPPVQQEPPVPKPRETKTNPAPARKEPAPTPKTLKKQAPVITEKTSAAPEPTRPVISAVPTVAIPKPILTRSNPVVKRIETAASEVVIDLYDNGEIDGDTVSIYHNNVLAVSRAGLTAKAVSYRFPVDPEHPHHELVMVAENLGSIPPNTSLMIVTAKDKRYEVFISSSEQKNAKVVIDLKE